MQTFVRDVLLFAALAVGVVGAFLAFVPGGENRAEGVLLQERRLEAKADTGGRLLFVGGSGVPYGIDCALFEERLGVEAFNLGWHAGLGLPMHLEQALSHARPGDVIVAVPEHAQWSNAVIGTPVFEYVAAAPDQVGVVPRSYYGYLADKGLDYLSYELKRRVIRWVRGEAAVGPTPRNACGSYTLHYGESFRGFSDPPQPLGGVDQASVQATAALLADAARRAQAQGAQLYVAFPPVPEPFYPFWKTQLDWAVEATRRTGVDLLTLPEPAPLDAFYDTPFHLGEQGARRFSAAVADTLAGRRVFAAQPLATDAPL